MPEKHIGKVVQVMGPVLDIRFADGELPELLDALDKSTASPLTAQKVTELIGKIEKAKVNVTPRLKPGACGANHEPDCLP